MAYIEELESPKYELINGEEVMMSPANIRHNRIQGNLHRIIATYLRGKRCEVFFETKVQFDALNYYIPDLIIVCDKDKIKINHIEGAPDLVVEVLSPSTGKRDIGIKKEIYEHYGVKEYWIISPNERSIVVYHLKNGKFVLDDRYTALNQWEKEAMSEKELSEHRLKLKVSLYNDLEIDIAEIFENMM